MKRTLLILGPLVGIVLILMIALQIARPSIESWVLANLERISRAELPVIITAKEFRLGFLLPQAELLGVRVVAKPELGIGELDIDIDRAVAKLDFLQLLAGRLQLSSAVIEGLATELDLDPLLKDESKPQPLDWKPIFRILKKIPVTRLALQNASVTLSSARNKLNAELDAFDLLVVNQSDRVHARLDLQDSEITWGELSTPARVQTETILTPQGLDITDVRVLGLGSLVRGSASFTNLPYLFLAPEGSVQFELKAALPQVSRLLQKMQSMPSLQGSLELKGNVQLHKGDLASGGFRVFGQNLAIDKLQIGQIETEGRLADDILRISRIELTQNAGLVDVKNIELALDRTEGHYKGASLKAAVQTDSLDLHDLLKSLGVGDLPLEMFVDANLKCAGPLWPDLLIDCGGSIAGDQMEVSSGTKKNRKTLVALAHGDLDGNVSISLEKIKYDARIRIGQDEGRSRGTVIYEKGFDIDFATPSLSFAHVRKIADLKIEGSARLEGKTWGNADTAKFQIAFDGQNIFFEDFFLGQPRGRLRFDRGTLFFEDAQGTLGASSYQGTVAVDLVHDQLTADFKSDNLDLIDVAGVFERSLKIPTEISGTGQARATVTGPLEINHLTYQAEAQFNRVGVAGETFDQVVLVAHANAGEFKVDRAVATKGKSHIDLTGEGHPSGQVSFLVEGKDLPLEQSENIAALNSNISGLLNFNLRITDHIKEPRLALKARATNIFVEEQEVPEAEADLTITPQEMAGTAQFVGGKLQTKFQIPFHEDGPFALDVAADDWNFTTVFALLGGGPLLNEYQAGLTAKMDLKAEHGGFWKSSGKARFERLFLKRGSLSVENSSPMEMTVHNGAFSFENFLMQGRGARLEVRGERNTRENLSMRINAQAELRLFQIFLPFLEEFSGRAKIEMSLAGPLTRPDLLGSAETENAFVKAHGFPHPFEKIAIQAQFSQSRVILNSAKGELGGGTFLAEGGISINGPRDIPTQIHLKSNNVSLNVPDRVHTVGSGEYDLTGNWFPFTLSGTHHVQSGLFEKELGGDADQRSVQKSSYLPKVILQRAFEPLLLDLLIVLDQPMVVKNSMIDGTVNGQIRVTGPPGSPILAGQINTEKGTKLTAQANVFEVITANLKFNNPKEINPEIYASARSRVNEYDINLLVQGTAKNPVLHTSSVPPLSEQDIVSLLALGVTSDKTDRRFQTNAQNQESTSGSYQLGAAVLQQIPLFQQAQKATGLNVQFSSNYDDTKNVETKIISVSRQVSEKVKASAARLVGDQTTNEVKIEYSLNPNVSAIGTYQQIESAERTTLQNTQKESESIFGLDLQFRKEFR